MRSLGSRLAMLEQRHSTRPPVFRMLIGETEQEACVRLGLNHDADAMLIQRVIVDPPDRAPSTPAFGARGVA